MHYISSNFNLLSSNKNWLYIKNKANVKIDDKYNGILLSINDLKINEEVNAFHIILYFDENNLEINKRLLKEIVNIAKKKKNKIFFIYIIKNTYDDLILNNNFILSFKNIKILNQKNIFLNFIEINDEKYFSERNRIFLKFPFDINFIKKLSNKILNNISLINSKPYKLIILDCDNTLWGGILDEDEVENLKYDGDGIGQSYKEFQQKLLHLKKQGFILSISSKNTEKNVWQAMKNRKMILQKKDFINPKINWNDKGENIKNLINELTLRPQDSIFIDDNLIEIKKVKNIVTGINTLHLSEPIEILNIIKKNKRLQKIKILKEDLKKYKQYKIKSQYENLSKKINHSTSFFKSLKQKVNSTKLTSSNFERALQLFNKTNQFNFSLNRYSSTSLKKILKDKRYDIKLFNFKDKFGDHGLIGSYITKKNEKFLEIIDFVISCRVINRYVEDYIIYSILKTYKSDKYIINYKETTLNKDLIPNFLKKKNFKLLKESKGKSTYEIEKKNNFKELSKIFTR